MVLIIEQTVGFCDGSEARTEMFRTSHQDRQGDTVFQATGTIIDGTIVYI